MLLKNPCFRIIEENCVDYRERQELYQVLETNAQQIGERMISNLYGNTLMKSNIDFGDIPASKGNIENCSAYPVITSTLSVLSSLARQSKTNIPEVVTIEKSITYIKTQRHNFEKAFKMQSDALMMYYNALVYSCIEATSIVLSNYVDYIKNPNNIKMTVKKKSQSHLTNKICMQNLNSFNKSCKDGSFNKLSQQLLSGNISKTIEPAISTESVSAIAMGVGIAMSIIPLLRTVIYYFYYSRMKISNFLEQQSYFLQLNEANINSSIFDAKKKKEVLSNQKNLIKKFEDLSDKIRINDKLTTNKVDSQLKNENKNYTLSNIQNDITGGLI